MPLILHLESEEEVDAASYASNAVDCGTFVRYTFTKVPLTMIIDDNEVYFFRGSQFPNLARSIPKRIAEHITA